ncbi:MAG: ATP-binding protein [Dehalococcoidales bacterium]|nr:ATP-binding protein [Dehalococcoidales bacterium]NLE90834.1 ATP-binding protein [Dehalococcoidales bacterium]
MEHIGKIIRQTTRQNIPPASISDLSNIKPNTNNQPACSRCGGVGFYHPKLANGQIDYARVVSCSCLNRTSGEQKQAMLFESSNLGPLSRLTFDNLLPEGRSGYKTNQVLFKAAYQAAKDFAENPSGWFVLIGPSGSGKTHIAAAVAVEQLNRQRSVLYITVPDLLEHMRASYNPTNETSFDNLLDEVRNAPMLLLDDLGVHAGSPWSKEKLDQLLSYRFNRELPTLITLLSLSELDQRVLTRINDPVVSRIFYLETEDDVGSGYSWEPGLELQKQMTFETFDWKRVNLPLQQRENLEKAYRLAVDYARSPDGWLVWQGVTGSGKTHLASAIVNYLFQSGKQALFIVVPEFIDHLRSTFSPDSRVSYDRMFERVKIAPFLVLDDFGEQTATPWAQEKLYQVINYRYNARLATVITTTRSLEELDSRIRSRFLDPKISTPFALTVPDYRADIASHTSRGKSQRSQSRRYNSKS